MKKIMILNTAADMDLSSALGIKHILEATNDFLQKQGKPIGFDIAFATAEKTDLKLAGNIMLKADMRISDSAQPDLVIIPPRHNPLISSKNETLLIEWVRRAYIAGSEIASLCNGVFFLAATGLLDGKTCSTHWMLANEFQAKFPKVTLSVEKVITDQNGIYTSGGAYSYLNLILYLIEKYEGHQIATWASKCFGIDIDRKDQSQFIMFQGQKNHKDPQILEVQEYIEEHVASKLRVSELAKMANMDDRNFIRRFRKATYNAPLQYIQRVKIEAAKRKLEITNLNINEIMYSLAWSDSNSFRRIFKKHTNLTPTAYRQKYSRS